ncbi:MAG: hypothetical protein ACQETI_06645 [Halobacteriota archaeon]
MRRRLALVALALLVVLAGCGGASGPSGADATETGPTDGGSSASDGGADSDADSSDGTSGTEGESSSESTLVWERFNFQEGEYYHYEVDDVANDGSADITWEVLEVDGDEVTAEITFDDGTTSFSREVTGQNATILFELQDTSMYDDPEAMEASVRASAYLTLGPFNALTGYFASRELKVGNSWELSGTPDAGYMTANVEGTDEYAGKECYVTAIRVPDTQEWEDSDTSEFVACISPEVGLSLYSAYYDPETGDLAAEITLVEYRIG